jgi:carbon monoxide dehydrogenase subunit G
MKLEHEFRVPVPITQAWDVLLDVERIAPCMPGATVESFDGETVNGRVKVKVGPIQVTYGGTARFIEKNEAGRRVTLDASGKEARGSGTAKATIVAVLQDEGSSTLVNVTTDLAITGKPAQFGRGVMVEVGNKLLGRFADCLAAEIGIGSGEDAVPAAEPVAPEVVASGEVGAETAPGGADSGAASGDGSAEVAAGNGASEEAVTGATTVDVAEGSGNGSSGSAGADSLAVAGAGNGAGASTAAAGTPSSNGGSASAAAQSPQVRRLASATATRPSHLPGEDEALDLLDIGGAAILKRVAPVALGLVALIILWRLLRRR